MYGYWFDLFSIGDRPLILVGYQAEEINRPAIIRQFQSVDPIVQLDTFRNNHRTHRFYYRICHGYRLPSESPERRQGEEIVVVKK